jgi:hypothetical protein
MIKEAIEKIEQMTKAEIIEIDGRQYSTKTIMAVVPPCIGALEFRTLSGFVAYLATEDKAVSDGVLALHIESPLSVAAVSSPLPPYLGRQHIARARHNPFSHRFGIFMPSEEMTIWLMTSFNEGPDKERLLKLIGNIRDEKIVTLEDDGVSQQVTARAGIARVEQVTAKAILDLAPHRTFAETSQPTAPFLFRMRAGADGDLPSCALFDAGGNQWEVDAMENIAVTLRQLLHHRELSIPVIA